MIRRCAIVLAAWLPFFALWVLFAMSFSRDRFSAIFVASLISMGSAGLLGIAVWHLCRRWPWPLGFNLKFYLLQVFFALLYAVAWTTAVYGLESLRRGSALPGFWSWPIIIRQFLIGIWFYAIFAGVSHAAQTRNRLHEKEMLAASARLDAIRARLNPHFLFNALLAFEQLRYEDRLKVHLQIDPASFAFNIPPFSIQTLAENAVRHAISIRSEGGSIWIKCDHRHDGTLRVGVRDDGPGGSVDAGQSHQFGLRSLRERLRAAFGPQADLQIQSGTEGFEASFVLPSTGETRLAEPARTRERLGEQK